MKWQAKSKISQSRRYEIKHVPSVGFYLYVFENDKCICDYLQDTLQLAVEFALEDFNVPKDAWEKSD